MQYLTHDDATHGRCHVALYENVLEQVAAVKAAGEAGRVYHVRLRNEGGWLGRSDLTDWRAVARAVETSWPAGLAVVDAMLAKLAEANLPKPETRRPRREWREDDGAEVDLDRLQAGRPYWLGGARRPRGGPRVITLLVQIGANANVAADTILWRGACSLALAQLLENAGYRTELLAYDFGRRALTSGAALLQATWVKTAGERLDMVALINAVSGWYFRTVNFGSISLVPGQMPAPGLGSETIITPGLAGLLARTAVTPWLIHNVWSLEAAVTLARQLLGSLSARKEATLP